MEMEVDDDGSQHPVKSNDFGIQPDFDILEEEDKEVSVFTMWKAISRLICVRAAATMLGRNSKRKSRR